jgi:hypothetical protein
VHNGPEAGGEGGILPTGDRSDRRQVNDLPPAALNAQEGGAPAAAAPAAAKGALEGTVYNQASGLPIGRVKVVVRGLAQETLTDDEGNFRLREIPAGAIELDVSYLGFVPQTATVTVPAGGAVSQDFHLSREGLDRRGVQGETVVLETFQVVAEPACRQHQERGRIR